VTCTSAGHRSSLLFGLVSVSSSELADRLQMPINDPNELPEG
jgi:hypothetical protein